MLQEYPLPRDAVLHSSGEPVEFVYFPLNGIISLLTVSSTGEEVETAMVGRDGAVGGTFGAFGTNSFGLAKVRIPGTALRASYTDVLRLYNKSSNFRTLVNGFQAGLFAQDQR